MNKDLFERAQKVIPGGVNSPVRAFKSVGREPVFISKANGCRLTDEEGNEYIDYIASWGPMILGHNNEQVRLGVEKAVKNGLSYGAATALEVEIAELITDNISHVEMIRMVNSGTEAVMSALRLARGFTGKDKIIKFEGNYHGHSDSMLVKSGSGTLTFGTPNSAGVTKGCAADTLNAKFNDIDSVKELFENNKNEIACIIIEPVAANMGLVLPKENFLKELRELCDENNALLIFDEVITGFRLCFGGAASYFNITPDLVCYGKIIGAGMPVGAYGGRKDIMSQISPCGNVYQAGTLSGNPIAMTAGIETLKQLLNGEVYKDINQKGDYMAAQLKKACDYTVNNIGSLNCVFLTKSKVESYEEALSSDTQLYAKLFSHLIENGIYVAPAQFEAMFIGSAHTKEDIDYTVQKMSEFFMLQK